MVDFHVYEYGYCITDYYRILAQWMNVAKHTIVRIIEFLTPRGVNAFISFK